MLMLLVLIFFALNNIEGARILGVIPTPSYSHQIIHLPIFKELALRGHDIVLITTNPINDPSIKNLKEIDLGFVYDIWNEKLPSAINENSAGFVFTIMEIIDEVIDAELGYPEIQNLITNQTEYFDLVMIEYMLFPMFAFKHRFNCPFIGLSSFDTSYIGHQAVGNPTHSVLYPEVIMPFDDNMNFFERMLAAISTKFLEIFGKFIITPKQTILLEKHFGKGYPTLMELAASVDMLFLNTNPVFTQIRPFTPATISIGGGIHIQKEKPLPKDLKEFLDNAKEGVIYFSLGSNVKSKDLSEEKKKIIMQVFSELPYKVLWKFESDDLPGKPDNVKIMKWVPQQDVLRHPNIKVFITQGGLQSLEEALFSHVPIIGMPFMGDQAKNALKIQSRGLGLTIEDHKTMTSQQLKSVILEVINNPKYRNKVKELATLVRDEPMNALEKAVWWTEYVIRNKGAQHLKGPGLNMPFYQYYYLDVIFFLSGLLFVIFSIFYFSLKFFIRKIKNFCRNKKVKQN